MDAPVGSPSGCADDQVSGYFGPLRSVGVWVIGSGGVVGCGRADVPALVPALRGGRRGGAFGPPARQGLGQAGAGGSGGGGRGALPGALQRLHGETFPRASASGPRVL